MSDDELKTKKSQLKQHALNASLNLERDDDSGTPQPNSSVDYLVKNAEVIYQWLIKETI